MQAICEMSPLDMPLDMPTHTAPLHFDPDDLGRYLCREDCTVFLTRSHIASIGPPRWALIKSGRYVAGGWWHIDQAIRAAREVLQN